MKSSVWLRLCKAVQWDQFQTELCQLDQCQPVFLCGVELDGVEATMSSFAAIQTISVEAIYPMFSGNDRVFMSHEQEDLRLFSALGIYVITQLTSSCLQPFIRGGKQLCTMFISVATTIYPIRDSRVFAIPGGSPYAWMPAARGSPFPDLSVP